MRDPSLEIQEGISPSSPYNPGPQTENFEWFPTPRPQHSPRTQSFSSARGVFRRLFYGNTEPGTQEGRQTVFRRGLLLAFVIGVVIAAALAVNFVIKGVSLISMALPLIAVIAACVLLAGAVMCCVYCVNRFRGRTTGTHHEHTYQFSHTTSQDLEHTDSHSASVSYSQTNAGNPPAPPVYDAGNADPIKPAFPVAHAPKPVTSKARAFPDWQQDVDDFGPTGTSNSLF